MSGRGRGRGRGGRGGFGGPRGGGGGGGLGGFNSDIDYATMVAFNKAEKEKALFPPMETINTSEPTQFEKLAYQYNRAVETSLFRSPYFFIPSSSASTTASSSSNQQQCQQTVNGGAAGDDEIDDSLYGDLHLLDIHGKIISRARQISKLRSSLSTKEGQAWARSVWDERYFPPKLWNAVVNSATSTTGNTNATSNRKYKPNLKTSTNKKRTREDENVTTATSNKEDLSFSLEDGNLEIEDNDPLNLFPDDDDGTNPIAGAGADGTKENDLENKNTENNNDDGNGEDDDEMNNYEDDEGEDDYDNNYFDNGEEDDFGDLGVDGGGGEEAEY